MAFDSLAANLVAGDTNGWMDVCVHDRRLGRTTRVSVPSAGDQANDGGSYYPSISVDGRVAFESFATNLVPGDSTRLPDVFVYGPLR